MFITKYYLFHNREEAASRIQSIARGKRDRERVKVLKAEQRVMAALQQLMDELGNPELKGKGREILSNLGSHNAAVPVKALVAAVPPMPDSKPRTADATKPPVPKQTFASNMPVLNLSKPADRSSSKTKAKESPRNGLTLYYNNSSDEERVNSATPVVASKSGASSRASAPLSQQQTVSRLVADASRARTVHIADSPRRSPEDSEADFYQSPDSGSEPGTPQRVRSARQDVASASPSKSGGYVSSPSLSGSDSALEVSAFSRTVTPGSPLTKVAAETAKSGDGDALSPQTPYSPSTNPLTRSDDDPGMVSHGSDLVLSQSDSSPLKYNLDESSEQAHAAAYSTNKSNTPSGRDAFPKGAAVIRLKIPKLSKETSNAFKRAGDVFVDGGTPEIEALIDDGMTFPPEGFDKVTMDTLFSAD
jgi:hypothetical protein